MEAYFECVSWAEVRDEAKRCPGSVIPFMIVPALEMISGRRSAKHQKVLESIRVGAESSAALTLEVAFVCDLAGILNCSEQAVAEVSSKLFAQDVETTLASTLYNVTHALFFGTIMGHRDLPWLDRRECLSQRLAELGAMRVERGDFDLGAELILCSSWIKPGIFEELGRELARMSELAESHGSIPPFVPRTGSRVSDFEHCYHPTIVVLAVLAEYSAWKANPSVA